MARVNVFLKDELLDEINREAEAEKPIAARSSRLR